MYYMNVAQIKATLIDPNVLIAEIGRGGGKTEGVMGPRIIRVAQAMPRELAFLIHRTYAALLTNIVPNLLAYFNKPIYDPFRKVTRPMLEEGIDYVIGTSKLPKHFIKPRYPVFYPKHSFIMRNGFNLQLVSSDQPESVAGRSGVHAFVEEMKLNKGEKVKTRVFPALRGSDDPKVRNHYYYQGITGVSDTARVDLGEYNWYEEYENNTDQELIDEIATVAKPVNDALIIISHFERLQIDVKQNRKPASLLNQYYPSYEKALKTINLWSSRLSDQRRKASYYMRASSFVNKDFLEHKFFKQQFDMMSTEEFLTAICAVRIRAVVDRFFAFYSPQIHRFSDSFRDDLIMQIEMSLNFRFTSAYLKYYDRNDEMLLGYDPGKFQSLVVSQEKKNATEVRTIKEFTCYSPADQVDLAREFNFFFGDQARNRNIKLYYDRAANKTKEEQDQITTDAKLLKRELESYGFIVELMNERQATIYHWQQKKLLDIMFSNRSNAFPRPYICGNHCPDLCSSIMLSPLKKTTDGKVELDKTSEVKVPMKLQAPRSTQLPSAYIYFLYGRYGDRLSNDFNNLPSDLPSVHII